MINNVPDMRFEKWSWRKAQGSGLIWDAVSKEVAMKTFIRIPKTEGYVIGEKER